MKILHYIDNFFPSIGGGELYIDSIVKNLPNFEFDILTNHISSELKKESYHNKSTIYRIPPCNYKGESKFLIKKSLMFLSNTLKSCTRLNKKKKFLKKHTYDLVHFHGEGINIEFRTFDKLLRIPFLSFIPNFDFLPVRKILTLHSFISYYTNHKLDLWWEKRLINMFDNIICVDLFIYNEVRKIIKEAKLSKKIWFIPNSVDTKKFQFIPLKKSSKLKALFVGRLSRERGLNLILDFIKNMPDFVEFVFVCAGLTHLPGEIKKCLKSNKVSFFENIDNDKLPTLYQSSDIVLNFVKVPGISRITLEAMSCGRPVIMLEIGNRYPVIHEKTGFLIKEDLGILIDLLEQINKNKFNLVDISREARKIIESEYNDSIILNKIENIYQSFN